MRTNTRLELKEIVVDEVAASYTSDPISLDNTIGFAVVAVSTASSLTNKTFTTVSLDAFTSAAHGYKTGLKVRFTTSGSLPTGLSADTDYYLIRVSDDVLMVASSQDNAVAGDYLTISGGTGTQTINVQTFAKPSISFKATIDNELWVDLPNANYQLNGDPIIIEHEAAYYHKVKVLVNISSGQYDINCKIMTKGF